MRREPSTNHHRGWARGIGKRGGTVFTCPDLICGGKAWRSTSLPMNWPVPSPPALVDRLPTDGSPRKFRELDRYPAITRDIAMIVPEKLSHAEILRVIQQPAEPLLESVQLFDLFEITEGVAPTASGKSLAYRLTYRAKNRTLTTEEVNAAHAKIRERLKRELGVTLRE